MPSSTSPTTRLGFDYDSLDAATSEFVQQQTGEIRALMKRTAQDIIEVGQRLIEVKKQLGHGRFGDWLSSEFDWTDETARRFMNVAQQFSQMPQIVEFAPSALYELAAPSTPEPARAEALARAKAGEPITYSTAKAIRNKHRATRVKSKPPVKETSETLVSPQPESVVQPAVLQPQAESVAQPALSQPELESVPQPAPVAQSQAQNQTTENPRPKQEILAILPKKAVEQMVAQETEVVSPKVQSAKYSSIQAGSWWQVGGRHLLFCGNPNSPRFQERLPNQVSLQLAFPPERNNWLESVSPKVKSSLCLWSSYKDQGVESLHNLVEEALRLYTESDETTVFLFLPDPQLLVLAHELDCQCMVAEPDLGKCQKAIALWQSRGMKIEPVKTLRF
jgi:hypothetical protein